MSLKLIEGEVKVLGDNIDTDVILPGRYLVYTDPKELGKHALEGLDPDLPTQLKGKIIVAGRNFGCGSSREHAVLALIGAGVKAIVAESFARIFYRNSINRGLLVIEAPGIKDKVKDGDRIVIDLEKNCIHLPSGECFNFKPIGEEIIQIIEMGGLIEKLKKELGLM
jgi:3-isopropylmalate/(R)-2-methylmalate dehydratase small subunit